MAVRLSSVHLLSLTFYSQGHRGSLWKRKPVTVMLTKPVSGHPTLLFAQEAGFKPGEKTRAHYRHFSPLPPPLSLSSLEGAADQDWLTGAVTVGDIEAAVLQSNEPLTPPGAKDRGRSPPSLGIFSAQRTGALPCWTQQGLCPEVWLVTQPPRPGGGRGPCSLSLLYCVLPSGVSAS